jgi:hypothetical protein
MFAIVIFILSMTILTYVWTTLSSQFTSSYGNGVNLMQSQLQELGTSLLLQGSPPNWNSLLNITNVTGWDNISIGLGSSDNAGLSYSKILSFTAMANYNYEETKAPLGVGYDYYIIINSTDYRIVIGRNPFENNAYSIQTLTEPVSINGAPANLTIDVWTNTSFGIT